MPQSRSFIIFILFLILVLFSLGTWQLSRKTEKEALLEALRQSQKTLPQDVDEIKTPFLFEPLYAKGHFLAGKTIFLQSKTYQGKNGVHILSVFKTQKGQFLLVQRGWCARKLTVPPPLDFLKIEGIARVPSSPNAFQPPNKKGAYFWVDLKVLSQEFSLSLLPYYLIAKVSHDPLILSTPAIPFPSNNHLQYAITWYSLAFFLLGMLLWRAKKIMRKEYP